MPRYYFDVTDLDGFSCDREGCELADCATARRECGKLLPNIARDQSLNGELHVIACDIRDETGRIIYRAELTYRGTADPAAEAWAS